MENKPRRRPPIPNSKKTQARINIEVLKKAQAINPKLGESGTIRKAVSEYANKEDKQYKAIVVSDFNEYGLFAQVENDTIIFCHHEHYEQYKVQYKSQLLIKCNKIIELLNGNYKIQIYKDSIKEVESHINTTLEGLNHHISISTFDGFIKSSLKFNSALENNLEKRTQKINECQKELKNKKNSYGFNRGDSFNENDYLEKVDVPDTLKWVKESREIKVLKTKEEIKNNMDFMMERKEHYLLNLERKQNYLDNVSSALEQGIELPLAPKFIEAYTKEIEEYKTQLKEIEKEIKTLEKEQHEVNTNTKQVLEHSLLHLVSQDLKDIEIELEKSRLTHQKDPNEKKILKDIQMKEQVISDIKDERNLQDVFAYLGRELSHYESKKLEYFNKSKNKAVDKLNSIAETIYKFTLNENDDTLDSNEEKKKLEQLNPSAIIDDLYGKKINIFHFSGSYLRSLFARFDDTTSLEGVYYHYSNTSLDEKKALVDKAISVSNEFESYNDAVYKVEFLEKVRKEIEKEYKLTRRFSLSNLGFFEKPKEEYELKIEEEKENEISDLEDKLQKSIQNFIDEYENLPNIEIQIRPKSSLLIEFDEVL